MLDSSLLKKSLSSPFFFLENALFKKLSYISVVSNRISCIKLFSKKVFNSVLEINHYGLEVNAFKYPVKSYSFAEGLSFTKIIDEKSFTEKQFIFLIKNCFVILKSFYFDRRQNFHEIFDYFSLNFDFNSSNNLVITIFSSFKIINAS
jgi:hypothetical protein